MGNTNTREVEFGAVRRGSASDDGKRRAQMATAAEARLKKSTAADVSKAKRERNFKILFPDGDGNTEKKGIEKQEHVKMRDQVMNSEYMKKVEEKQRKSIELVLSVLLENDDEKVIQTLKLAKGICKNILKYGDADDQKYSKLRLSNSKVQEDIVNVPGAIDLMFAVGFQITEMISPVDCTAEDYLYYDISNNPSTQLEIAVQIFTDLLDRLGAV